MTRNMGTRALNIQPAPSCPGVGVDRDRHGGGQNENFMRGRRSKPGCSRYEVMRGDAAGWAGRKPPGVGHDPPICRTG